MQELKRNLFPFCLLFFLMTFYIQKSFASEFILPGIYSVKSIVSIQTEGLTVSLSPNHVTDCDLKLIGPLSEELLRGPRADIYSLKIVIKEKIFACLEHEIVPFALSEQSHSLLLNPNAISVYAYFPIGREIRKQF